MNKRILLLVALTQCSLFSALVMADIHLFKSLDAIESRNQNVPWILVIWSTDCPPCYTELELLTSLKKRGTNIRVEFFSFDPENNEDDVIRVSNNYELDTWFSPESNRQKLQMMIDPNWRGELPRSYWYQADGTRCGHSGALTEKLVLEWASQQTPDCHEMN